MIKPQVSKKAKGKRGKIGDDEHVAGDQIMDQLLEAEEKRDGVNEKGGKTQLGSPSSRMPLTSFMADKTAMPIKLYDVKKANRFSSGLPLLPPGVVVNKQPRPVLSSCA